MKTITLLGLAGIAFVSLSQPTWADPRGGGHVGGGGRAGGGSRAAPALYGGVRGAPAFRGAYFAGRSVDRPSAAPRFQYGGARMAAVRPQGIARSVGRSTSPYDGRVVAANRQPSRVGSIAPTTNRQSNRVGSIAGRNRGSDPRTSANRQSFLRNRAFARHDANWHRDWDRHHAHFHNNQVFVFVDGFWWGLPTWYYQWGYYPYYVYYPYDYYGYPYDYYGYDSSNNDDQSASVDSDQDGNNATVSTVQSELAKLGYYHGAIDGVVGDETEAALARYQEDHHLSVTGTLTAATLQALGLPQTAS